MTEIQIDAVQFAKRLKKFYKEVVVRNNFSVIEVASGKQVDEEPEEPDSDSATNELTTPLLHFYFLGYEFPETLLYFTKDTLFIVTNSKKKSLPIFLFFCTLFYIL